MSYAAPVGLQFGVELTLGDTVLCPACITDGSPVIVGTALDADASGTAGVVERATPLALVEVVQAVLAENRAACWWITTAWPWAFAGRNEAIHAVTLVLRYE